MDPAAARLKGLVHQALEQSNGASSPQGQVQAMKLVDNAVKELSQRPDAVLLASRWVETSLATDPYLLWGAGAVLEVVAASSKLWLMAEAKVRNYSCVTLMKACATSQILKSSPWISSKIQRALSNAFIHEWPDNFPEFAPELARALEELSPVVIQLSTVVLNRASEIAVSRNSTKTFGKFGSISMSSREKIQVGLKDIVPFLFRAANDALKHCGDALASASPGLPQEELRVACKAVLEAISECVKISEENAIKLQVETSMVQILFSYSRSFVDNQSLACKALECIAEVTSQTGISLDDETYFSVIMQELISLFAHCKRHVNEDLAKILMNIACILMSKHITRLERSPALSQALVQLLTEVFELSFGCGNPTILLKSLDVWEVILDHVYSEGDMISSYAATGTELSEMYKSCNLSVANAILRRLFLYTAEGHQVLDSVDDTPGSAIESLSEIQLEEHTQGRDVSDFSELDHYHSRCEEIFGLLIEIYPEIILQMCTKCFEETHKTYGGVIGDGKAIFKVGESATKISHDISTCLRLITRCAPNFGSIGADTAESVFYFVIGIANHILGVYDAATKITLSPDDLDRVAKYASVNGKLAYNCLSMFSIWIRVLAAGGGSAGNGGAGGNLERVVETYLSTSVRAFEMSATNSGVSPDVLVSSAGSLSSFSTVVQPGVGQMQGIRSFQTLLGLLPVILSKAPQRATSSIWVFLSNALLKKMDPKQKEADHLARVEQEFSRLVSMPADVLVRGAQTMDAAAMAAAQSAAHTLASLVGTFGGKTHSARVLLCKCISPILPSCMVLVKVIAQNPGADATGKVAQSIISLLIACFDVIAKEMGEDFITTTVKEFIDLYSNPTAMRSLSVDTGASLIELLTLLARRPGAKFKALSMQTIQWCLGIWQTLGAKGAGGITVMDVLQLLCRVLRYQWRACGDAQVHGVLGLMVFVMTSIDPNLIQRFILDEIIKLDDQTQFFKSAGFAVDQAKAYGLACALMTLLEVRQDLQEALLAVLYRVPQEVVQVAVQQKTQHQNLLQDFFSHKPQTCAEFGVSMIRLLNDSAYFGRVMR